MNAIVTVIGEDQVGIIAKVCNALSQRNVNILDVSQTILNGSFAMMMAADCSQLTVDFSVLSDELRELGRGMNLSIRIQREEIFDAMHSI